MSQSYGVASRSVDSQSIVLYSESYGAITKRMESSNALNKYSVVREIPGVWYE